MKRRIVGLCGYAQVGKDTLASLLSETFFRVAFADALKADLAPLLSYAGKNINNPEVKKLIRPLLVEYGRTMRLLDPDYWIKRMEASEKVRLSDPNLGWVVSDVRYVNEAAWVVDQNDGLLLYIERPGVGPANEEELKSIREVIHLYAPSVIRNASAPYDMYTRALPLIEQHFSYLDRLS